MTKVLIALGETREFGVREVAAFVCQWIVEEEWELDVSICVNYVKRNLVQEEKEMDVSIV